jgi:hypothetical protein
MTGQLELADEERQIVLQQLQSMEWDFTTTPKENKMLTESKKLSPEAEEKMDKTLKSIRGCCKQLRKPGWFLPEDVYACCEDMHLATEAILPWLTKHLVESSNFAGARREIGEWRSLCVGLIVKASSVFIVRCLSGVVALCSRM